MNKEEAIHEFQVAFSNVIEVHNSQMHEIRNLGNDLVAKQAEVDAVKAQNVELTKKIEHLKSLFEFWSTQVKPNV
jgi:hypothetical protein